MQHIIKEFLETNPTDTEIEEFYIREVMPVDKRSIEEILMNGDRYLDRVGKVERDGSVTWLYIRKEIV